MGKLVKEGYRVQMNSNVENTINVFNEDGSYIKFVCVNDGLYSIYLDDSVGHVNYVMTVSEQKDNFSDIDNKKADLARYIQESLCLPSDNDFANVIDKGGIKECGVDRRYIKLANIVLGPAKTVIEGKTIQRTNKMPRDIGLITHNPPSIIERYGMVTLGIDVMHINKRPFVLAVSKHIKYFQCIRTRNKTAETFMNTIRKMKTGYQLQGFKVKMIYADQSFASCQAKLSKQGVHLVCGDTNAHVHFVERGNRLVKIGIRYVQSMHPK